MKLWLKLRVKSSLKKKYYNQKVRYIDTLIVLLSVALLATLYFVPKGYQKTINTEVQLTLQDLNHYIKSGVNSVHYLATQASKLSENTKKLDETTIKNIHLVGNDGAFALDMPSKPNIIGYGDMNFSAPALEQMQMALSLDRQFAMTKKMNANYAWLYFISKYHFVTMFPYISSAQYICSKKYLKKELWQYALPSNNAEGKLFFTPVYLDDAGKGLVVTIGKPVYKKSEFQGTLNIDITLECLHQLLKKHNLHNGKYFIVNEENQIVASSQEGIVFATQNNATKIVENSTMMMQIEHSPWKLYYKMETKYMYLHTLYYVLFIGLLLWLLFRIKNLMLDLNQSKKNLEYLASVDSMTGLYNRRYFYALANKILKEAQQHYNDFSIVLLDIDTFKMINDTYGHATGDDVIVHLSTLLKENLNDEVLICRYGGDEFILLLPHTSKENALVQMNVLHQKIQKASLRSQNIDVFYSVSLGVSCFEKEKDNDILAMISRADQALYRAKELGRNRVEFFQE